MKPANFLSKIQIFALVLISNFAVVWAKAQEKAADLKVDVDLDKGGSQSDWMSNPLVWVIGALVLILIIALVARGGGSKA